MSSLCDARNSAWFVLCVSADASSIQVGLLPCYCFASPDLSRFLPLFSPHPPPTGDSAPPHLEVYGGWGYWEQRLFWLLWPSKAALGSQGQGWSRCWAKSGWMWLGGSSRNCPGLGRVDGREEGGEGPCRDLSNSGWNSALELPRSSLWVLEHVSPNLRQKRQGKQD